jgi:Zn-dependent metalloprotease
MKRICPFIVLLAAACILPSLQTKAQTAPVIKMDNQSNDQTPRSVRFETPSKVSLDKAEEILYTYLPVDRSRDKMIFRNTNAKGRLTVQRYDQYYNGVKVEHGSYAVVAKDNNISLLNGKFYRTSDITTTSPVLTESGALNFALSDVKADKYSWQVPAMENLLKKATRNPDATNYPKGSLVYVEDLSSGKGDGKLNLAYKFRVYVAKPLSNSDIFVDATSGKILFRNSIIKDITATGGTLYSGNVSFEMQMDMITSSYVLNDLTRGGGVYTYTANNMPAGPFDATEVYNSTTSWPTSAAIDAHWATEKVYDYWYTQQGRDSYDGMGSPLISVVNYDVDFDNAFWNGTNMTYGDGSGTANGGFSSMVSLDICGHELGHGICQNTCDLMYMGESGALNEGLSDIWGAVIENWANPNESDAVPKSTWDCGEEVGVTPLRSLSNPKLYGNPDTYGGMNWTNTVGCSPSGTNDQCGVHNNSGVLNHWFYLLSTGGTATNDNGHSYEVPGIGMTDAASIVYGMELALFSFSNFSDAATTSIAVADMMFGSCSLQKEAVSRAWYAAGVDSSFFPCTPQISFNSSSLKVTEKVNGNTCPATKTVNIPVVLNGPLPSGGTATVTVTATSATAVAGIDYTLSNTSLNFPAGSSATQFVTMTIYDNGAIDADKEIILHLSLVANGCNATLANVYTQSKVIIINDDRPADLGGIETHTVGVNSVISNLSSPYQSAGKTGRSQFIIKAQELLDAGVRPNVPITSIGFKVTTKVSTITFNDFTVKMGNTNAEDLTIDWIPGLSQVYNGSFSTSLGWNTMTFQNNFIWNGTDNLVVEACFNNTTYGLGNDKVEGVNNGGYITAYNTEYFGSTGCMLPYEMYNLSSARPVTRFKQDVPSSPVETVSGSTRSWDVRTGQDVYYYSAADGELIARLNSPSSDVGCLTAEVTQQGNGFVPFSNVNRSKKEVSITPAQAAPGVSYETTIYLRNTEIAGTNLTNARIIKTNALTDAGINATNTVVVTPTVVNGISFTGFQGNFTGFSRFFIVDNNPTLSVKELTVGGNLGVVSNPFHDQIIVNYTVRSNTTAMIHLYDITGKIVYSSERLLSVAEHGFTIDVSALTLATGNYILQIVTKDDVLNEKLLKN